MKFLLLVFLCSRNLCLTEGAGSAITFPGYKVVRFVPENMEDVEAAKKMEENPGVVVLRPAGNVGQHMDLAIPPHLQGDFLTAARNQMHSSIMSDDLESMINRESMELAMEDSASTEALEVVFTQYMPLDAVRAFETQMQTMHPDMVQVFTYGKSFEGRDLKVVKIEREGGSTNKHAALVDCTTHAREWISTMQGIHLINDLCENNSSEVNTLLDNFVFWIVTVMNPDGYVYSWEVNRMWRKNRQPTPGFGCVGTDNNRNFDFGFGGEGTSDDGCSEVYHGPSAFSTPESKAMSGLLKGLQPLLSYFSMHSYSQMMLESYGCSVDGKINPRAEEHEAIANEGKAALKAVNGVEYTSGNSEKILYPACGVGPDWASSENLCKYSYTYELRDKGTWGFLLPESQIKPGCEEATAACKAMWMGMLKRNPL